MQEYSNLEAVIFDLGGVIFGISIEPVIQFWAECAGMDPQEIGKKFGADQDYYERFETNEITPEEYRAHVCEMFGAQLSNEDFDEGWNRIYFDVLPGIESILTELRKHVRLVVLTNTNGIHAPEWRTRYSDTLIHFERIFASHEIGARKPEPEAFQIVLDYLNIDLGKVVFFDDTLRNVQGAQAVGINSFVVTTPLDVIKGLRLSGLTIQNYRDK
ncbi:HAD family hydrolase [Candidatus Poribacteria bacterium]